jgi:iron complex transport system substrate-binding protein
MRIISLVPSATEILCALDLAQDIVGISHDCDYPAVVVNRPRISSTNLAQNLTSYEIDEKVRASMASGHSLYSIRTELLESLNPDLVITQEQCSVCAVDRDRTVCSLESLKLNADWLSLASSGFSGLYQDILKVASATGRVHQAQELVAQLAARLECVARQTASEYRPRVFCLSWFDPLMSAGDWISEMVKLAGGDPHLGAAGESSQRLSVDLLQRESPEIIFLLPCSFSQNRSAAEWRGIRDLSPWKEFPAVRQRCVFALESSLFHRPGPRLVDGVELMAALIHPHQCSFRGELDVWRKVA